MRTRARRKTRVTRSSSSTSTGSRSTTTRRQSRYNTRSTSKTTLSSVEQSAEKTIQPLRRSKRLASHRQTTDDDLSDGNTVSHPGPKRRIRRRIPQHTESDDDSECLDTKNESLRSRARVTNHPYRTRSSNQKINEHHSPSPESLSPPPRTPSPPAHRRRCRGRRQPQQRTQNSKSISDQSDQSNDEKEDDQSTNQQRRGRHSIRSTHGRNSSRRLKRREMSEPCDSHTPPSKKSRKRMHGTQERSNQLGELSGNESDHNDLPDSPSKCLALDVSRLSVGGIYLDDEKDEEEGPVIHNSPVLSVRQRILAIQKGLLTADWKYGLKCREKEFNLIFNFFMNGLECCKGDCFYLCGSPGTGKTASMNAIIKELNQCENRREYSFTLAKINAMTLETPGSVYLALHKAVSDSLIYDKVQDKSISMTKITHDAIKAKAELNNVFIRDRSMKKKSKRNNNTNNNLMFIIIIDEMDNLLTKNCRVLYQLFEWSKQPNSHLLLLGIANSIDLTEKFLPRLRVRKVEPKLLIFEPYNRSQLSRIIIHRLSILNAEITGEHYDSSEEEESDTDEGSGGGKKKPKMIPFFDEKAIMLCASKVAKTYGDIRKCLEICRSALRLLLEQINEHRSSDDSNSSSSSNSSESSMKVGFREMQIVIRQAFSSPMVTLITDLPNKQKVVAAIGTLLLNGLKKIYQKKMNDQKHSLIKHRRELQTEMIIASKSSNDQNNNTNLNRMSRSISADMIRINPVIMTMDKLERYYNAMCIEYSLSQASSTGEFSVIVNHLISSGIFSVKNRNNQNNHHGSKSRKNASMTRSRSSLENRILSPVTELDIPVPIHEMEMACEDHYTLHSLFNDPPPIPPRFQA